MGDRNENETKADNAEDQKSVKKEETTPAPANPPKEKGNLSISRLWKAVKVGTGLRNDGCAFPFAHLLASSFVIDNTVIS